VSEGRRSKTYSPTWTRECMVESGGLRQDCPARWTFSWTRSGLPSLEIWGAFSTFPFRDQIVTCTFRVLSNASACEKAAALAEQTTITTTFHPVSIPCPTHQQSCQTTKMKWTLMRLLLSPRFNSRQTRTKRAKGAPPTCQSSYKTHYHGTSRTLSSIQSQN